MNFSCGGSSPCFGSSIVKLITQLLILDLEGTYCNIIRDVILSRCCEGVLRVGKIFVEAPCSQARIFFERLAEVIDGVRAAIFIAEPATVFFVFAFNFSCHLPPLLISHLLSVDYDCRNDDTHVDRSGNSKMANILSKTIKSRIKSQGPIVNPAVRAAPFAPRMRYSSLAPHRIERCENRGGAAESRRFPISAWTTSSRARPRPSDRTIVSRLPDCAPSANGGYDRPPKLSRKAIEFLAKLLPSFAVVIDEILQRT